MAAKGTNAKIKELKSIKPEKISTEQLEKVQTLINDINRLQMELGQIETKKHALLHHVSSLQEAIGVVREEFEKEYGTSDVNIKDGIINYPDNGEADKKD
jgi:FtsZ-binding cell division protein ZapB